VSTCYEGRKDQGGNDIWTNPSAWVGGVLVLGVHHRGGREGVRQLNNFGEKDRGGGAPDGTVFPGQREEESTKE